MFWEVEGIKHSCVVPVTVWISACVIWVAPYFPLVFPLSLNFTSSFIVMQIENYVVGFVSIHFHDFWHLSARKTHFTPSVWMNLCWFVSFCHVYFRFQYLTLGACHGEGPTGCFSWWLFSGLSAVCPRLSGCCSLKQDWIMHLLFSHLCCDEHEHSPACLPVEHLRTGASVFHHATSAFLSSSNGLAVILWVDTGCPEGLPVRMVQ